MYNGKIKNTRLWLISSLNVVYVLSPRSTDPKVPNSECFATVDRL